MEATIPFDREQAIEKFSHAKAAPIDVTTSKSP